jgi:hypothetical protein
MRWFLALPLALLPCATLAQDPDPAEARRAEAAHIQAEIAKKAAEDRRAVLQGILAEPTGPNMTKEEQGRRNRAVVELETLSRLEEWAVLREAGTFLVPGARFPYQMTFAEGAAEAKRLVGLIEAADQFCEIVLSFERLGENATRVQCGDTFDPFNGGEPFDVVERGDGVSVYKLDNK